MENEIVQFLAKYGIFGLIGIALAIVLTDLIKIPYKKWAEKMASKNGVDKIVYTKWLFVMPIVIAFIASLLNVWYLQGWGASICKSDFPWVNVIAETIAIAGTAGSVYGVIENFQQSNLSKKISSLTNTDADEEVQEAKTVLATKAVSTSVKKANEKAAAKAEAKAKKEAEKAEKEEQKAAEKAEKLAKEKAEKIAELQKQIQALQGVVSDTDETEEAKESTTATAEASTSDAEPWVEK